MSGLGQVLSGGVDGVTGLVDLGSQGLAAGVNKIFGTDIQPLQYGQMAKQATGIPAADPSSPAYHIGNFAGGLATAGTAALANTARAGLSAGVTALKNTARQEAQSYAGGMAGQAVGEQIGGDLGGLLGGVAGGMAGGIKPLRNDIETYHGSLETFDEFKIPERPRNGSAFGKGVYTTDTPILAYHYAGGGSAPGNLYRVEIDDDLLTSMPAFDVPLQDNYPEIFETIQRGGNLPDTALEYLRKNRMPWEDLAATPDLSGYMLQSYAERLKYLHRNNPEPARLMDKLGIKGWQVFDPDTNANVFVNFDPNDARIIERASVDPARYTPKSAMSPAMQSALADILSGGPE